MIETLLPDGAIVVSTDDLLRAGHAAGHAGCIDPAAAAVHRAVLAAEATVVAGAVPRRRQDFVAGRACAHAALDRLASRYRHPVPGAALTRTAARGAGSIGAAGGFAVLAGPGREPIWPEGVVGSITHCTGYCAAAVARAGTIVGLGIDAEPRSVLEPHVRVRVGRPEEFAAARTDGGLDPALLVFSAKEAFYKAWYPLTGRRLDFLDARVRFEGADRSFDVRPVPGLPGLPAGLSVHGRWTVTAGHVFTAVIIVRDSPAAGRSGD